MRAATASRASRFAADSRPTTRTATGPLLGFFALAFAFIWAWLLPMALSGQVVRRGDGWPTHILALLGPLLAALVMLTLVEGRSAVRTGLAAMVRWPRSWRWRLAAVSPLGFLAVGAGVVAVTGQLPAADAFTSYSGAAASVPALLLAAPSTSSARRPAGGATRCRDCRPVSAPSAARSCSPVRGRCGTRPCSSCSPATEASARSPCRGSSSV